MSALVILAEVLGIVGWLIENEKLVHQGSPRLAGWAPTDLSRRENAAVVPTPAVAGHDTRPGDRLAALPGTMVLCLLQPIDVPRSTALRVDETEFSA